MAHAATLSQNTINTINRYKDLLDKAGIKYQQVYAFGSHTKGKAKPWSDIDVGIVSTSFRNNRHQDLVNLMTIRDELTLDIEPHPIHPDDFNDKYDSLAQEIKRYGVII